MYHAQWGFLTARLSTCDQCLSAPIFRHGSTGTAVMLCCAVVALLLTLTAAKVHAVAAAAWRLASAKTRCKTVAYGHCSMMPKQWLCVMGGGWLGAACNTTLPTVVIPTSMSTACLDSFSRQHMLVLSILFIVECVPLRAVHKYRAASAPQHGLRPAFTGRPGANSPTYKRCSYGKRSLSL
jgi:hypothetical protein